VRLIRIKDDMYILKGSLKVDCGFTTEEIKSMYDADTVLRQDNRWFAATKVLDAEFEDIKLKKK
tara:strand:+ start:115 stop:306 length:192 start_codon:yes stop_codon:yes gene_type:complete